MGEGTPALAAETEALRETYAALNRGDIPATITVFDPQVVWIEPDHYPEGGTHRGLAALTALLSRARATWAEGGCEPERFVVAGDKIAVFIYVRVRLKHTGEWVEGPQADVYTFREGKATEVRIFPDRREALAWAGVAGTPTD